MMLVQRTQFEQGAATLIFSVVVIAATIIAVLGQVAAGISQVQTTRASLDSRQAFFAGESILEDAYYMLKNTGATPNGSADVEYPMYLPTTKVLKKYYIKEEAGGFERHFGKAKIDEYARVNAFNIQPPNEGTFTEDAQAGWLGITLKNSGAIKGNVFSNGPIVGKNVNQYVYVAPDGYAKVSAQRPSPEYWAPASPINVMLRKHAEASNAAQMFIPSYTGQLQAIGLYICMNNSFTATLNIKIKEDAPAVWNFASDTNLDNEFISPAPRAPAGSLIQAGAVSTRTGNSGIYLCSNPSWSTTWTKFVLDAPVPVQKGVPYWIVINAESGTGPNTNYYLLKAKEESTSNYFPSANANATALWANADGSGSSNPWCLPLYTSTKVCGKYTNSMNTVANLQANIFNGVAPPTGHKVDLLFQTHINTEPGVIDNVILHPCVAGGGSPCGSQLFGNPSCPTNPPASNERAYASRIINSSIYIPSSTQSGYSAATQNCYTTNTMYNLSLPENQDKTAPLSGGLIDSWKKEAGWDSAELNHKVCTAAEGCILSGGKTYVTVNSNATFPANAGNVNYAMITGDVTINNAAWTLRNFVYIKGNLVATGGSTTNNCVIQLSNAVADEAQFPEESTAAIIVEGRVDINNCVVKGRVGDALSHLIIISMSESIQEGNVAQGKYPAIWVRGGSSAGDIFLARKGLFQLTQAGTIQAAYGEGIVIEQNATLTSVKEGVGNIEFAPSGYVPPGVSTIISNRGEQ